MDVPQYLQQWEGDLSPEKKKALREELAVYINHLLLHDFNGLLNILYRIDVPERKLKTVLAENKDKDAGELIADLLIKRQEEKLALRRSSPPADNILDDERW